LEVLGNEKSFDIRPWMKRRGEGALGEDNLCKGKNVERA
jgi:hypothetical protein